MGLLTKEHFEGMFKTVDLDEFGDGWFIKWRSSQFLRYELYLKMFSFFIHEHDKWQYLEIGCAQCIFLKMLVSKFPSIVSTGTDISQAVIDWNKKNNPDHIFKQCALPTVDFSPCIFDLVSAFEVIYYLSREDQIKSIKNISRVLRPGGYFLVSGGLDGGENYWDEEWICQVISREFEIVKIDYHYAGLYSFFEGYLLSLLRNCIEVEKISQMSSDYFKRWKIDKSFKRKRLARLIRLPVMDFFSKGIAHLIICIIKFCLGIKIIPSLCFDLNKFLFPIKGRSRIVILARKPLS